MLRAGLNLTPLTPIDANFNPADTRIDEDRYHVSIGYAQPTAWGEWTSLASYAYSGITDVRAFLHPDLSGTADTQSQRRHIDDAYLDTHLVRSWSNDASLIAGIDVLYGRGRQTTQNGNDAYTVPLDGSVLPPAAASVMPNETGTLDDRRLFAGQYAQLTWKLDRRWEFVAGLRLNEIVEHKDSSDATTSPQAFDSASVRSRIVRPSETLAASYRAWQAGVDEGILFASFRNTFKPAAVDFGPDYTPDLLSPETARSYELGLKGAAAGRRLSYQAELFLMDFSNLVVATSSGALANAAAERLKGVEGEARFEVAPQLTLAASAAYHEATYTRYLYFDGVSNVDVAGRSLPLSPQIIIAGGILYTPPRGASATAIARYVGRRYLDEGNTAPVGGYTTLDSSLGYAWGRLRLTLEGTNLTDRRPPVTSSEFGSQSFYVLPARMAWVRAAYRLR